MHPVDFWFEGTLCGSTKPMNQPWIFVQIDISDLQVHCVEVQENTEHSTDNVASTGNLLLRNIWGDWCHIIIKGGKSTGEISWSNFSEVWGPFLCYAGLGELKKKNTSRQNLNIFHFDHHGYHYSSFFIHLQFQIMVPRHSLDISIKYSYVPQVNDHYAWAVTCLDAVASLAHDQFLSVSMSVRYGLHRRTYGVGNSYFQIRTQLSLNTLCSSCHGRQWVLQKLG